MASNDFKPNYPNLEAIENSGLPADLQLREKVKHLSMQLFGLAVDLGNEQLKYLNFSAQLDAKNKEIANLKYVLSQKNDYIRKYCVGLKALKVQVAELQGDSIEQSEDVKKPKRITKLTTEERQALKADDYEKRIAVFKTQVGYWKKRAEELANGEAVRQLQERLKKRDEATVKRLANWKSQVYFWRNKAEDLQARLALYEDNSK